MCVVSRVWIDMTSERETDREDTDRGEGGVSGLTLKCLINIVDVPETDNFILWIFRHRAEGFKALIAKGKTRLLYVFYLGMLFQTQSWVIQVQFASFLWVRICVKPQQTCVINHPATDILVINTFNMQWICQMEVRKKNKNENIKSTFCLKMTACHENIFSAYFSLFSFFLWKSSNSQVLIKNEWKDERIKCFLVYKIWSSVLCAVISTVYIFIKQNISGGLERSVNMIKTLAGNIKKITLLFSGTHFRLKTE